MGHGIKAIFFDLHGVLVDTQEWHRVAFLSALQDFGYEVPIPRSHPVWRIYGGTMKQLEYLCEIGYIEMPAPLTGVRQRQAIYNRKQKYTRSIIHKRCVPVTKITNVIKYADDRWLRLAVVTNGNRVNAEKMLMACGLYDYFEFIITREDVGDKIKPHPLPYLTARYRMGLAQKEALVIDDSQRGIMSGVEACCRTWKLKKQDDLSVSNLIKVLDSYKYPL